ncbi:MAG: fibronectin type III domain-containing protein [Muribaculaceae bacterium]|nr:fibronectin type III domain-containing protein [Muribaculaceae bacterium]
MNKYILVAAMATVSMAAWAKPDNPTDFQMKFDLNGGNPVVSGSFVCSTHQYSWDDPQPIKKITKVKVIRGCYSLGEMDIPVYESEEEREPGSLVEFTDEFGEFEYGYEYNYVAYIYDENGEESYGKSFYLFAGVKPGQPTLTGSLGENGSLPVTLTVTAPETLASGDPLSVPLSQIRITEYIGYNDERIVKTINDPVPGKTYTVTDDDAISGKRYDYRAYAICEYGDSEYGWYSIFVGEDVPGYPTDLTMTENEDGSVTLNWKAPENGKNGGYVNPANIRYKVERHGDLPVVLAEDLQECTFTDPLDDLTGPTAVKYEVMAYNSLGEGDYTMTSEILRGPAYQLPFEENFNAQVESYWGYEFGANTKWAYEYSGGYSSNWDVTSYSYSLGINGVGDGNGVESSDDDAYIRTYYASRGNIDTMVSSAIDFKDASFPVLTFYHATKDFDRTSLTIGIRKNGESTDLLTFIPGLSQNYDAETEKPAWISSLVYLTDAVGSEASVYFTTVVPEDADDNADIALDRIIICDYPGVDKVAVTEANGQLEVSWEAPKNSYGEEPLSYDVKIDGVTTENVEDTKYVVAATRADDVASHKVAIRANYDGIPGRFSSEFDVVPGGSQSGIMVIGSESDTNVEYYDLNGLRVVRAMKGSTLIRRSVKADGSVKVEKVIVK